MELEKGTLTELALSKLRDDIVGGAYEAGSALRIEMLKERYGMGASPLREALARLVTEGFVTNEANRGFRVAPMSPEDLADITLVRQTVERQALRLAMERGGDEWEVGIVAALRRLTLAANRSYDTAAERFQALDAVHWQFHRAMVAGCGSPRLLELQEIYYRQGIRYRRRVLDMLADDEDFVFQHEELARALFRRDIDAALAAMHEHIDFTRIGMSAAPGRPAKKP